MRITSKGQVTIPQHIREQAGLMPGTDVVFTLVEGEVRLRKGKASGGRQTRGEKLVASLRGSGHVPMSTDEIIALMRGTPADEETDGVASPRR